MFSGLIEEKARIISARSKDQGIHLLIQRPKLYKSLKLGESINVNGCCLTLKSYNTKHMSFDLGPETLKITRWQAKTLQNTICHLERSLTLQKSIGGHLVTGHVDALATVTKVKKQGMSLWVQIKIPKMFKHFFWPKCYITLNGVSLTVNIVTNNLVEISLIPTSLKQTHFKNIQVGDKLNFEVDYMSRVFKNQLQQFMQAHKK